MNECEKRGLSIVEGSQLNQESITEELWHKIQKAEQFFLTEERNTQKKECICHVSGEHIDNMERVDIPLPFSCPEKVRVKKHRHIVGLSANRLDDSRQKWQVKQVVMGCDGLMTS